MFIDESGFNLAMTLAYAYAPKGQRAVGRVPKNRGENTSLVAAISLDEGVSDAMTLTGAVDGDAFLAYIRQILASSQAQAGTDRGDGSVGGASETGGSGGH